MSNTYDIGDTVHLEEEVQMSGSFIDPTYNELVVRRPDGRLEQFIYGATGTFIKESTGKYYLDYFLSQYGQYVYHFFVSGTATQMEEQSFVVRIPQI